MVRLNKTVTAAALFLGLSTLAAAQKVQAPKQDAPKSQGAKNVAKADKKTEAAKMKGAEKAGEKEEDRAEKAQIREAHQQSSRLLQGVKLTADQRHQVTAIEKKFEAQLRDLKKQEHEAEKTGASTTAIEQQIAGLAIAERTELRAVLTTPEQAKFDANAMALDTDKKAKP